MHPAFSVVFLTTLIGAGQGLFLAAFGVHTLALAGLLAEPGHLFQVAAAGIAFLLMLLGLGASFGHLGRKERAWRSAARWRTSWLSREVILLPACMVFAAAWALLFAIRPASGPLADPTLLWAVGAVGSLFMLALFVSTAMIYACIEFIEEWASPLTVLNFTLLGCASGTTAATALAAVLAPELVQPLGAAALLQTGLALFGRAASLARNARLRHKSTMASAIGVRHNRITQRSMGMMGGSFNTREFFHGQPHAIFVLVRLAFLLLAFPAAGALLWLGLDDSNSAPAVLLLAAAFLVQYVGLVAERWYFFAEAKHPQNLYYQTVS